MFRGNMAFTNPLLKMLENLAYDIPYFEILEKYSTVLN